ncbi:hypothetical protein [Moraxella lacunata]|uniref:hypothetical protein n=1 Tax=Moraxella lacunata TaxID=477 RepID=UPI003EDEC3B6
MMILPCKACSAAPTSTHHVVVVAVLIDAFIYFFTQTPFAPISYTKSSPRQWR